MPLADTLASFQASALQCDRLIANAHRLDPAGIPLFPKIDQHQITVAAFLNLFVAWESFLEESLAKLMSGEPTISGGTPVRYVSPVDTGAARLLVVGVMRYFDYGNHDHVRKMVGLYFFDGYPYQPHLNAIVTDLSDLRTLRNASAHITSSTQAALESFAQRVFSIPRPGIDLYSFLMAVDPRSNLGNTVFAEFRDKLLTAAELIALG